MPTCFLLGKARVTMRGHRRPCGVLVAALLALAAFGGVAADCSLDPTVTPGVFHISVSFLGCSLFSAEFVWTHNCVCVLCPWMSRMQDCIHHRPAVDVRLCVVVQGHPCLHMTTCAAQLVHVKCCHSRGSVQYGQLECANMLHVDIRGTACRVEQTWRCASVFQSVQ